MIVAQLTANALIAGSVISLVAVGFSLIYTTNRFAHFAHGTVVAAGGYAAYYFSATLGLPFLIAVVLSVLSCGLFGAVLYHVVYRPLLARKSSTVILLIASIALMIFIENVLLLVFGSRVISFDVLPIQKGIPVLGATVTPLQLGILFVSLLLFIGLFVFVRFSKLGRVMRAVADNPTLAELTGIPTMRIQRWSFIIGSAFAGVAGILIGLEQSLVPHMGTNLIIRGFTGAVIGGIHSLPGAVLGGYVLAAAENYGIWFLPSSYKEFIAFGLLFVFLLFKPQGIFGISKGTKG